MRKIINLLLLSLVGLVFLLSSVSAEYAYYYPSHTSYGDQSYDNSKYYQTNDLTTQYKNSYDYDKFIENSASQDTELKTRDSNFDSTDYSYDYRGPLYEKTTTYMDDLLIDKSSKSSWFHSRSKDIVRHVISATTTEKYVGETESIYSNTQNRRENTANLHQNIDQYQQYSENADMFSFGKQRLFDAEEYRDSSYSSSYYYRPIYNDDGYYNWRY